MKTARASSPVTVLSFVGDLGCIRFPPEVRSAAGVKRGDRLALSVSGPTSVVLDKLPVSLSVSELAVQGCACENPGGGCHGASDVLTVGWSYVQLEHEMATALGFLPGRPLKLIANPSQITVSVQRKSRAHAGVQRLACPP